MISVTNVLEKFEEAVRNRSSKRFKFSVKSRETGNTYLTQHSFKFTSDLKRILAFCTKGHLDASIIIAYDIVPGVASKYAGKLYNKNYVEVVLLVDKVKELEGVLTEVGIPESRPLFRESYNDNVVARHSRDLNVNKTFERLESNL